jgi:hypothetical protein
MFSLLSFHNKCFLHSKFASPASDPQPLGPSPALRVNQLHPQALGFLFIFLYGLQGYGAYSSPLSHGAKFHFTFINKISCNYSTTLPFIYYFALLRGSTDARDPSPEKSFKNFSVPLRLLLKMC